MLFKKEIQNEILALLFLSIGGWFLHLKVHAPSSNPSNYVPFLFGVVNVFIVPFLLCRKKSVIIGYLINGFGVIIGAVTMVHLSLSGIPSEITLSWVLLRSTLPFIIILMAKLFIAQRILEYFYPGGMGRFFTTYWWFKHFIYVSVVYLIGYFIGR